MAHSLIGACLAPCTHVYMEQGASAGDQIARPLPCHGGLGQLSVKTRSDALNKWSNVPGQPDKSPEPRRTRLHSHRNTLKQEIKYTFPNAPTNSGQFLHGQQMTADGVDRVIIPGTFQTPLRGLLRNRLRRPWLSPLRGRCAMSDHVSQLPPLHCEVKIYTDDTLQSSSQLIKIHGSSNKCLD